MASSDAPPPDAEMHDADAPSASILGTDELRCIFAALLTTREPAKDLGRCLMVAKEWRDTLSATPSIWFKLLRAVDPAEADAAAAAAPAPSAAAAANADPFRDHDFRRRFVEQYCWRKTRLCSRCFVQTDNPGIRTWKVRLCSPCMAASILNKTDAGKTFLLGPKDFNALPTWTGDVYGPFGDLVKFYFRRHLERAAAEKHGAAGVEGARAKQLANKAKRTEKKQNLQLADKTRLEAVLQAHGMTHGSPEWRQLRPLSAVVDALLAEGAKGKGKGKQKRRPRAWGQAQAQDEEEEIAAIACIDDALIVVEKRLTRISRSKLLMDMCRMVNILDANTAPALKPHFDAFVKAEDESAAAKHRSRGDEPSAKRRKSAAAPSKRKKRGYASSDESSGEEEEPDGSDDDSGSEEAAAAPAAGAASAHAERTAGRRGRGEAGTAARRGRGPAATAAGSGGAIVPAAADRPAGRRGRGEADTAAGSRGASLRDAAVAVARELVVRKCRATQAQAQLDSMLALAMLDGPIVLTSHAIASTEAYKTMLAALAAPLPADIATAPDASSLGSAAAADILAGVTERTRRVNSALDVALNALSAAWAMPRARMLQLLGVTEASSSSVPFEKLVINGTRIRNELVLHGEVLLPNPAAGAEPVPLQLDGGVSLIMRHLRLKLRKGEMKERYDALLVALSSGLGAGARTDACAGAGTDAGAGVDTKDDADDDAAAAAPTDQLRLSLEKLQKHHWGGEGAQLNQALNASAVGYISDDTAYNADIKLLPADGDDVVVALAPLTNLGEALEDVAAHLFKTEPVRKLFTRWVLDGHVKSEPPGAPQPATVEDVASRILRAEDSRASLLAAIFGAQAGRTVPITAPRALVDRLQLFFAKGTFQASRDEDALMGDDARAALITWAAKQLLAQAARRTGLVLAFKEAGLVLPEKPLFEHAYYDFSSVYEACGHSLQYGMGYLILGPRDDHHVRDLDNWSTNAIAALVHKARLEKDAAATSKVASANDALRRAREAEVNKLMRAASDQWSSQPFAQKHAKSNSALYKRYVTSAVAPAAPAAPDAAADDGGAGPSDAGAGPSDGGAAAPPLDAAAVVQELLTLFQAADGLSLSVLKACEAQERRGQHGGWGGRFYDF